ncbi:MAG: GNAT family N-acetyltransferase [Pseudomonadota bacterium]
MIPTLETERLILRPLCEETDFEPMAAFFASERSGFYGGPCDRAQAWRKTAVYPGHWALRGYGPFALEEKATGRFAGLAGPWFPEGFPEPEITWMLCDGFEGRGLATEAALHGLRFAYETLGWRTAVSSIEPRNGPSLRVAERLGAVHEYDFRIGDSDLGIFRHLSPAVLAEMAA